MAKAERTYEEIAERMRELGRSVRAGEMTPKQVDDGQPPRHDGWQEPQDITSNSVWWLPQTLLFYAWQDLARTREQWERFKVWGQDLWRDAPDDHQINTFDEAEALLRSDLSSGIVRAFGTDSIGKVRPIPYEAWDGLEFTYGFQFTVLGADGATAYSGVFVLRHEVVPLLITEHMTAAAMLSVEPETRGRLGEPAPKKIGAALKHDWPAAAGFAAAYGMHHDYPEVKEDFVTRMNSWFKDQGKVPDRRDLDRFVKALYDTLDQKPEK